MIKLEKEIYNEALKVIEECRKDMDKLKSSHINSRYVLLSYYNRGCHDCIKYDKKIDKFIKIIYQKGREKAIQLQGMHKSVGYFDELEICEIDINL